MKGSQLRLMFDTVYDMMDCEEGVTDYEFSLFINLAVTVVMSNRFYPDEGVRKFFDTPSHLFEKTTYDSEDFWCLICGQSDEEILRPDENGIISKEDLNELTPVHTVWREDGTKLCIERTGVYHILNVNRFHNGEYVEADFKRHNEIGTHKKNSFLSPDDLCPSYCYDKRGVVLKPKGSSNTRVTFVRCPKHFMYNPEVGVDTGLDDFGKRVITLILETAARLVAMSIRDNNGYSILQNEIKNN